MLIVYPLRDALASLIDTRSNGGLDKNRTQAINSAVASWLPLVWLQVRRLT